jgi:pyruvate formate lyase activating enzyme
MSGLALSCYKFAGSSFNHLINPRYHRDTMSHKSFAEGLVFDIRRYSVHDGPGIRTTVFLKGCPLECAWCHNPEGIRPDKEVINRRHFLNGKKYPYKDIVGNLKTSEEVFDIIEKDRIFYEESEGGATFSGGEPLMQPEFLHELIGMCRKSGIHTAVDTSGHAPARDFNAALNSDLLLYDIKSANAVKHKEWTGKGNELILKNLRSVARKGPFLIIRIPLVAGFNSEKAEITAIRDLLVPLKSRIIRVDILPFHNLGVRKYIDTGRKRSIAIDVTPTGDEIDMALQIFTEKGFETKKGS